MSYGQKRQMASVEQRSVGETSTDSRQYQQHSMTTEPPQQQLQQAQSITPSHSETAVKAAKHTAAVTAARQNGRPMIVRIVDSNHFEFFFAALIISNSIFVGVQVDLPSTSNESPAMAIFGFQMLYALCFTVELIMRVCAEGRYFLHWMSPSFMWNCLDVVVVFTSLFEIFFESLHILLESDSSNIPQGLSNVRVVRILRIVRLIRVVRIARVLRFIHALRTFIYSIIATLKALVWAMLLLLMIMYVFGILLTQAVQEYCDEQMDEFYCNGRGALSRHWGNLFKSMFTLFKSISGGLSWDEAVFPMHKVGPLWVVCFTAYISFTYLAVLNVVTGIFCQSAIETAQQNEDLAVQIQIANKQAYIDRIMKVFKTIDDDASGAITKEELQEHLEDPDMEAVFSSLEIETADAETLFALLDADGGNEIEVDEFVKGLMRLRGNAKRADVVEIDARLKCLEKTLNRMSAKIDDLNPRRSKGNHEEFNDHRPSRGTPTSGGAPAHPPPPLQGVASVTGAVASLPRKAAPGDDVTFFLAPEEYPNSRQGRNAVRDNSRGSGKGSVQEARAEDISSKLSAAIEQSVDGAIVDESIRHF